MITNKPIYKVYFFFVIPRCNQSKIENVWIQQWEYLRIIIQYYELAQVNKYSRQVIEDEISEFTKTTFK
ncbi:hypothetical protein GCM10011482_17850 [Enterococcus alcedinis]|uniref:Uncharacterized protein n=1 Tax=Enterococcus alcedinis TaxID=1274384 RepID=A0A917JI79_9ENTE|nr:hypothetical protein GCM10011482_17850 [Enterococcus alcedinis]